MPDSLAPDAVLPRLRGRFGREYAFYDSCASTQRLLDGKGEGAVAATDFQTHGRGRFGRLWEAPPRSSLLFSIVLEPQVSAERLPELTVLAAEAVANAVAHLTGLAPSVKHPNDVLIEGRKVAGVLGEASGGRVVLGIGVNVKQGRDELPVDAQHEPTSLYVEGARVERAELLAAILERLESRYVAWAR